MIRNILIISAAATVLLSACNRATDIAPPSDVKTLSATHAFDTPAPIKQVAFSPNDVASWLGAIAMVTDDGQLLITNIEGKQPKLQSGGPYKDVIGTNRKGKPALFLALTSGGELRPFIEADNEGNFKAIPISTDAGKLSLLCKTEGGDETNELTVITTDGEIVTLNTELSESALIHKDTVLGKAKDVSGCAADGGIQITLSRGNLSVGSEDKVKIGNTAPGPAINRLNGRVHLFVSRPQSPVLSVYEGSDLTQSIDFNIESGLSIGGLERASGVWATSAPFGGSGFNDGLIAVADADAPRLVILSKSYVERALSNADAR